MADFSKITTPAGTYNVKDETARNILPVDVTSMSSLQTAVFASNQTSVRHTNITTEFDFDGYIHLVKQVITWIPKSTQRLDFYAFALVKATTTGAKPMIYRLEMNKTGNTYTNQYSMFGTLLSANLGAPIQSLTSIPSSNVPNGQVIQYLGNSTSTYMQYHFYYNTSSTSTPNWQDVTPLPTDILYCIDVRNESGDIDDTKTMLAAATPGSAGGTYYILFGCSDTSLTTDNGIEFVGTCILTNGGENYTWTGVITQANGTAISIVVTGDGLDTGDISDGIYINAYSLNTNIPGLNDHKQYKVAHASYSVRKTSMSSSTECDYVVYGASTYTHLDPSATTHYTLITLQDGKLSFDISLPITAPLTNTEGTYFYGRLGIGRQFIRNAVNTMLGTSYTNAQVSTALPTFTVTGTPAVVNQVGEPGIEELIALNYPATGETIYLVNDSASGGITVYNCYMFTIRAYIINTLSAGTHQSSITSIGGTVTIDISALLAS